MRTICQLARALIRALAPAAMPAIATAQSSGAILCSPSTGPWSWSRNDRTRSGAKTRARQACRSAAGGAHDCRLRVWFSNACGALAVGPSGWGSGWGTTQARADAKARRVGARHSRNCRVELRVCSF
jgi:serine/threonine-protein kinase